MLYIPFHLHHLYTDKSLHKSSVTVLQSWSLSSPSIIYCYNVGTLVPKHLQFISSFKDNLLYNWWCWWLPSVAGTWSWTGCWRWCDAKWVHQSPFVLLHLCICNFEQTKRRLQACIVIAHRSSWADWWSSCHIVTGVKFHKGTKKKLFKCLLQSLISSTYWLAFT